MTAWGRDRDEALARLRRALTETVAVITGGATNRGVLLAQLPAAAATTPARSQLQAPPSAVLAMLVAAIESYDSELLGAQASFFAWSRRGRPQAASDTSRRVELRHRSDRYVLDVSRIGPIHYRVRLGDLRADVALRRLGPFESRMTVAGRDVRVVSSTTRTDLDVEVDGAAHHFVRDDGAVVRAPMPGVVVSVAVAPGDQLDAGDPVAVIESMKLETLVIAGTAGRVHQVLVRANEQVPAQAILVRLDSDSDAAAPKGTAMQLPPRPRGRRGRRRSAAARTC